MPYLFTHFFCHLFLASFLYLKGCLKSLICKIYFDKNTKWVNLSRVCSRQILCLVSGGVYGWNIMMLQSRVCSHVRYWCHLHTGGKFDCPRCLERFRLSCLNTTPTKSGTCTWPCSSCVYSPLSHHLPHQKKKKNVSCTSQTLSLLLHFVFFFLCLK